MGSKKHIKEFNNGIKDHETASDVSTDVIKKLATDPIFTMKTY